MIDKKSNSKKTEPKSANLKESIKKRLEEGYSLVEIRKELESFGLDRDQINKLIDDIMEDVKKETAFTELRKVKLSLAKKKKELSKRYVSTHKFLAELALVVLVCSLSFWYAGLKIEEAIQGMTIPLMDQIYIFFKYGSLIGFIAFIVLLLVAAGLKYKAILELKKEHTKKVK